VGSASKTATKPGPVKNPAQRLAQLVAGDLELVNAMIMDRMQSPVGMIPDLASHLVEAGGKRLRPMITLATASMLGYEGDNHIRLATAVEFIHSATLLHDDIVDDSKVRRGKPAANRLWGNSASILVGDFLFARSFSLMVETGHLPVLGILSHASSIIAEGEVHQLAALGNIDLPVSAYMRIIEAKTAELFAAAARVSAVITGQAEAREMALDRFGRSLGLAFQLVDDALDYGAQNPKLGKQVGDDFREGKVTLPLALAYHAGTEDEKAWWEQTLDKDERSERDLAQAISFMHQHGTIDETLSRARECVQDAKGALSPFPDGELRACLGDLCDFVVERGY
jgi:octaprenyl-diphosphate synthase